INDKKTFCKEKIVDFLTERGIAVYDTASVVRRLSDNASDKFLDIVQPTDIGALLDTIPHCTVIVATGQKAADVLARQFGVIEPKTCEYAAFAYSNRCLRFYRMPSSSRAYPLKLENKAEIYRKMFDESGIA
ncbi:MAG: uracil-DNA glycosylase family protein, partial [Prevotellaceae bacterium]|nr:uracil-DNA glycosylase family protein [Prevotellaceae bacterium]